MQTHLSDSPTPLAREIDAYCDHLTDRVAAKLTDYGGLSDAQLERIVLEAQQVSIYNPPILAKAVEYAGAFAEPGIRQELQRNLEEEQGHHLLYAKGLAAIGTDVEARTPWPASDALFARVFELMDRSPSAMLGSMYASEAIALFESETLREIARTLLRRRGLRDDHEGRRVIAFHDLHLGGVEQGHKDGLGVFLRSDRATEGEASVDPSEVWIGAKETLDAIYTWWTHLVPGLEQLT